MESYISSYGFEGEYILFHGFDAYKNDKEMTVTWGNKSCSIQGLVNLFTFIIEFLFRHFKEKQI